MAGYVSQTDTATMAASATDTETVAQNLNDVVNRMRSDTAPMESEFVGQGGRSFGTVNSELQTEMTKLNASLSTIADMLRTAGQDYTLSDEELRADMERRGAPLRESDITAALLGLEAR